MPPRASHARLASLPLALLALIAGCARERPLPTTPAAQVSGVLPAARRSVPHASAVLDRQAAVWLSQDAVAGCAVELDAAGGAVLKVYLVRVGATLPAQVEGMPVVAEVTGPLRAFGLTGRYRPLPIGVSLGNNSECLPGTLGCIVEKAGTRYALSANHVLARRNQAAVGEGIVQPSRPDGATDCSPLAAPALVARLSEFVTVVYDGHTENTMDAAIAALTVTDATCATLAGFYRLPGRDAVTAVVGMDVQKVGRTTVLTTGTVKAVNAKVKLTFPSGTALFVGQIITSKAFGDFGDSGSLVVTNDAAARPVGMVIGGSTVGGAIVTPIAPVLARFGVTICGR